MAAACARVAAGCAAERDAAVEAALAEALAEARAEHAAELKELREMTRRVAKRAPHRRPPPNGVRKPKKLTRAQAGHSGSSEPSDEPGSLETWWENSRGKQGKGGR